MTQMTRMTQKENLFFCISIYQLFGVILDTLDFFKKTLILAWLTKGFCITRKVDNWEIYFRPGLLLLLAFVLLSTYF